MKRYRCLLPTFPLLDVSNIGLNPNEKYLPIILVRQKGLKTISPLLSRVRGPRSPSITEIKG